MTNLEFVQARRDAGKSDNQIMQEMDTVNWVLRQGYRKPLETFCEEMETLFYSLLTRNEKKGVTCPAT